MGTACVCLSQRVPRSRARVSLVCCRSGEQVVATVKSKLKPTLLANWTVWPLAHVINFALVPPAQRILYINVVNVSVAAQCLGRAA